MPAEVAARRPDIAAIRQRADAATPGPWRWRGNVDNQTIRLSTRNARRGECTVMDFARWGMRGAQPRFQDEHGLMDKAGDDPMPAFEVCPEAVGRDDPRVYRGDITGLRHPDAEFMACARQDIDDLLEYIIHLEDDDAG